MYGNEGRENEIREVVSLSQFEGGTVSISDGEWILQADFQGVGPDLILSGPAGQELLIRDYFNQVTPPDLVTPGGVLIKGNTVEALAGPVVAGQFAQSAPTTVSEPIGIAETVNGQVWSTRLDGTKVSIKTGDAVFVGDVLETGDDGSIGILFADDSTFSLAENGRMTMDEMTYDPGENDGSFTVNLLQGAFTFVSGEIAKSDVDAMQIFTPTTTIGIRGTAGGGTVGADGVTTAALIPEIGFVGEMTLTNEAGSEVINQAGQAVVVTSFQQPPTPPFQLSPQQMGQVFGNALSNLPNLENAIPDVIRSGAREGEQHREKARDAVEQSIEKVEEAKARVEEAEEAKQQADAEAAEAAAEEAEATAAAEIAEANAEEAAREAADAKALAEELANSANAAQNPETPSSPTDATGQEGPEDIQEAAREASLRAEQAEERALQAQTQAQELQALAQQASANSESKRSEFIQAEAEEAQANASLTQAQSDAAVANLALFQTSAVGAVASAAQSSGVSVPGSTTLETLTQSANTVRNAPNTEDQTAQNPEAAGTQAGEDAPEPQAAPEPENPSPVDVAEPVDLPVAPGEVTDIESLDLTNEFALPGFAAYTSPTIQSDVSPVTPTTIPDGSTTGSPSPVSGPEEEGAPTSPEIITTPQISLQASIGNNQLRGDSGANTFRMSQGIDLGGSDSLDGGDGQDTLVLGQLENIQFVFDQDTSSFIYANPDITVYGKMNFSNMEYLAIDPGMFSLPSVATDSRFLDAHTFSLIPDPGAAERYGYLWAGDDGGNTMDLRDGKGLAYLSDVQSHFPGAREAATIDDAETLGAIVFGKGGDDTIHGSGHSDVLDGGDNDDTIYGNDGDDVIFGGAGMDSLFGGNGDDVFYAGDQDIIDGGEGMDVVNLAVGATVGNIGAPLSLSLTSVELVQSFDGSDSIELSNAQLGLTITTGAGQDSVTLADGKNSVTIRDAETINGGAKEDMIFVLGEGGTITGGQGDDTIVISGTTGGNIVRYETTSDGANAGESTGYDYIVGFRSGIDKFLLVDSATGFAGFNDVSGDQPTQSATVGTNAADLSLAELLYLNSSITRGALPEISFAQVINVIGTISAGTANPGDAVNDGIFVINDGKDSGIFLYQNSDGGSGNNNSVEKSELTLLAVAHDSILTAGDIDFSVAQTGA